MSVAEARRLNPDGEICPGFVVVDSDSDRNRYTAFDVSFFLSLL